MSERTSYRVPCDNWRKAIALIKEAQTLLPIGEYWGSYVDVGTTAEAINDIIDSCEDELREEEKRND